MADVRPSAIDWLWQNWIALGKVHVLAGEGGRGKSTILCDSTAITTTGTKWPDGASASEPGSVIILAAEDDVEDTLAPRLMAAGADLARVFVIRSVFDENRRRGFNLQADLERLEAEILKRDKCQARNHRSDFELPRQGRQPQERGRSQCTRATRRNGSSPADRRHLQ
jgi:hypothetical protein